MQKSWRQLENNYADLFVFPYNDAQSFIICIGVSKIMVGGRAGDFISRYNIPNRVKMVLPEFFYALT